MSKSNKLRKRLTAFVNQLAPDQLREQLVLSFLQMDRCIHALRGDAVEPIEMMDFCDRMDLELFYRCKKIREELVANEHLLTELHSPVYFMYKGRIHKSRNTSFVGLSNGCHAVYRIPGYDCSFHEGQIYSDPLVLACTIGRIVSTHLSFSRDRRASFFIDQTNRVFLGATWYLEEQKIEHFDTLGELRKYLTQNIVDDEQGTEK